MLYLFGTIPINAKYCEMSNQQSWICLRTENSRLRWLKWDACPEKLLWRAMIELSCSTNSFRRWYTRHTSTCSLRSLSEQTLLWWRLPLSWLQSEAISRWRIPWPPVPFRSTLIIHTLMTTPWYHMSPYFISIFKLLLNSFSVFQRLLEIKFIMFGFGFSSGTVGKSAPAL